MGFFWVEDGDAKLRDVWACGVGLEIGLVQSVSGSGLKRFWVRGTLVRFGPTVLGQANGFAV